jgi:radical SAM superfamily enzyme YgiQ (UPF0313 family)
MANIMLIYPQPNEIKKHRYGFSYTWALLGTCLSQLNHNVIMHDYSCESFEKRLFTTELIENNVEIVVIEFDTFALKRSENIDHGNRMIIMIKEFCPQIKSIAYGYYCCITRKNIQNADVTVKDSDMNCIISAISQCDNSVFLSKYKKFDDLPFVDRLSLQEIPYYKVNGISTLIQTAKGCENSCVFCQRKAWQPHFETHSLNYILSEFSLLQKNQFKNIWIIDENFTFQLHRAKQILHALIENKLTTGMNIAISSWANIDENFIDLAVQSNIKIISCGIESGNQSILKFYRKNIDLDQTKHIINYANEKGIFTVGNFILGAPMETNDTINQTFSFIRDCSFDQVNIKNLDYMEGSVLYDSLPTNLKENHTQIFACMENGLTSFTLEEMVKLREVFLFEYYHQRKELLKNKIEQYGNPYMIG